MLHCFSCGRDLPDNLAYCLYCGAKLEDDDAETVVNPTPIPQPVPYEQKPDSGIGKFILGSVLGGLLVILLVVLGGIALFSLRSDNGDNGIKPPLMNKTTNTETPTPARSPSPSPSTR